MIRRPGVLLLAILAIASAIAIPSHAQSVLTRHTREVTRTGEAQLVGRLP